MKQQLILAGNGTPLNRGCQAIETATLEILRESIADPHFVIAPMGVEPADTLTAADCERVVHGIWGSRRYSAAWLAKNVMLRVSPRAASRRLFEFDVLDPYFTDSRGMLQLGGDNFSLDYGGAEPFFALNQRAIDHGCPVVLWGASVGPFSAEPRYEEHAVRELSRATLILAREQLTADYLARVGVSSRVERVADPAFALTAAQPGTGVVDEKVLLGAVGFNMSPLYERYTGTVGGWTDRVADVVEALIRHVERPVVLIPHVMVPTESDHALLTAVAARVAQRGIETPVVLPPSLTASEIKWCIARLEAFVGARTHATIAALSSSVPTLSLAYSMKARGINRDVLGSEEYVVGAEEFAPTAIVAAVQRLLEDSSDIRQHLQGRMPAVRAMAVNAGALVAETLGLSR